MAEHPRNQKNQKHLRLNLSEKSTLERVHAKGIGSGRYATPGACQARTDWGEDQSIRPVFA
ncbi:MAG: hypothetical protein KatS3mg110_1552 [Pirellulaceae bacterium]|nr:MAG: hypothetical protein KatS3mg110_1552 [Pirellulaceae bacterium]